VNKVNQQTHTIPQKPEGPRRLLVSQGHETRRRRSFTCRPRCGSQRGAAAALVEELHHRDDSTGRTAPETHTPTSAAHTHTHTHRHRHTHTNTHTLSLYNCYHVKQPIKRQNRLYRRGEQQQRAALADLGPDSVDLLPRESAASAGTQQTLERGQRGQVTGREERGQVERREDR